MSSLVDMHTKILSAQLTTLSLQLKWALYLHLIDKRIYVGTSQFYKLQTIKLLNFSDAMYRECSALCDFVNEEIRKFSCAACLYIAHAEYKINGRSGWLYFFTTVFHSKRTL